MTHKADSQSVSKAKRNALGKQMVIARLQMGIDSGREIRAFEIAKKLGVSSGFMSALESGRKLPNIAMLAKMARVYPGGFLPKFRQALGIERRPVKKAP